MLNISPNNRNEIDERQELYYPAIMRAIAATGYKGYVAQEFIPKDKDAMASLEQSPETEDLQLLPALDKIVVKLSTRKQMLQRMFTDIKGFKNKTESINKLSQLLNSMETDINQTQYNEALGKLLRYTEEDINDFFKYLDNPNNFKSKITFLKSLSLNIDFIAAYSSGFCELSVASSPLPYTN